MERVAISFIFTRVQENTWVGLNDEATEGTFVWHGTDHPVWSNWYNIPQRDNDDCYFYTTGNKKLDEKRCTGSDVYQIVCQNPGNIRRMKQVKPAEIPMS